MALINCPSCGKPISDKAIKCPHCGFEIHPQTDSSNDTAISAQKEKVEQPKTDSQNNGYTHKEKGKNSSLRYIIAAISVLLVVGVVYFAYEMAEQQKQEELAEQQKQQKERLERFKNFRSNDLSAFMLHGRVKKMTEYSGQVSYSYYFSKEGVLTNVTISEGNYRCEITHSDRQLIVYFENPDDPYGGWGYRYVLDNNGRLTECISGGDEWAATIKYSNYDTNNWPRTSSSEEDLGAEEFESPPSKGSKQYSEIDKYGNWEKCETCFGEDTEPWSTECRDIEYYPIDDF